jgi:3-hydroxyisobutyrate dehydrogenase-like beta-hydroxyacid dehydrogenase
MSDQISVAMVGLGRMGGAVARNLIAAGFDVHIYNRTRAKAQPFAEYGATVADSPAAAAEKVTVVISSLMDDASMLGVVGGDEGIAAGLRRGGVHVGTTTVSPDAAAHAARLHREAGSQYVSGPVVGRPDAAEAGSLLTIVAGEEEAIEQARPVIEAYTQSMLLVGPDHGAANYVKLGVNYFAISYIELVGQLYAFAEKSGVGVETMSGVVPKLLHNPAFTKYAQTIAAREFRPAGFELTGGLKDVTLMLAAAEAVGAPLPYGPLVQDKMQQAIADGRGTEDWSVITDVTRAQAGLA